MSADNWADCPNCLRRATRLKKEERAAADEMYGKVPPDEWMAMRDTALEPIDIKPTFREDYEFYGAETGTLTVSYRGGCSVCGAGLKINTTYPIEGITERA